MLMVNTPSLLPSVHLIYCIYTLDDDGIIYYFNESTGESRWDPPTNQQAISPLREDSVEPFLKGLKPDELQKLVNKTCTIVCVFIKKKSVLV